MQATVCIIKINNPDAMYCVCRAWNNNFNTILHRYWKTESTTVLLVVREIALFLQEIN